MSVSRKAVLGVLAMSLSATSMALGETAELKVTRVALFSSGVGYFECDATVNGNASAELKFRTDQINDILKSLVVQDFDGGTVSTVGYASRDPVTKALKSFGVDITANPTLGRFLDQLRGEPVEIAGPRAIKGVILGVEKQKIAVDKNIVEVEVLNVASDATLEQVRLSELQGIKLTNEKIAAELQKALATLAASHDADKKTVVVRFDGQGQRRVRASFLLEAPIWKTSYRLVLANDKKPFLQGWATAENATEEDWKDIQLSLVSGRPISFTMDLYTPLYVPRPREELELYASLRPPTLEAGVELARRAERPAAPAAEAPAGGVKAARAASARQRAAGRAGGYGGGGYGGYGGAIMADSLGEAEGRDLALLDAGVRSVASAQEAGELFEYCIRTPVSIARQRSAMLPIVNEEVAGEKLSIFNPSTHPKYPLNGLRMENTTGLNLMQGPVTLFDGGVYAGDAKLPDLKPGEKRLIAYALDLAVEVLTDQKAHPDELVSLKIVKGMLWHRHKYVDERTYTIKNKDKKDRTVLIEQPYSADWKLVEPKEPYERTQNLLRFQTVVPAGQTVAQPVRLERVTDQTFALFEGGLDAIRMYLRASVISPKVKEALEKVVAMRSDLDRVASDLQAREKEVKEAVEEQARVRENLKTLQQNTDPYQRQLKKFDQLETQIENVRGQTAELRKEQETKRAALKDYLLGLNVE